MRIISYAQSFPDDWRTLIKDLPRRITNTGRVAGRTLSDKVAAKVRLKLKGGGWIAIYRNAIVYKETTDGAQWAIAGLSEVAVSDPPATTTFLKFIEGPFSLVMQQYQDSETGWPIDIIPPIKGGYPDTVSMVMADEGAVEAKRVSLLKVLPVVVDALTASGAVVDEQGTAELVVNGKVYADLAYMARRLELGFHGYPRVAHWGPAASWLRSSGLKEAAKATDKIFWALRGANPEAVPQMSAAEADELARLRKASWA